MLITTPAWLITSTVADEAAFRIDAPEPGQGTWMLSYLPTNRRLTRNQAVSGMVLAEMILTDLDPADPGNRAMAELRAADLGLTVEHVMWLISLRSPTQRQPFLGSPDIDTGPDFETGTTGPTAALDT